MKFTPKGKYMFIVLLLCWGSPIQLSIQFLTTLSHDFCIGNLGCHGDITAEASHSSFSKKIGAKIVADEPTEAVTLMMRTWQDDIAKKGNNEIGTYHLSAKATAVKMLSKSPLCEKDKTRCDCSDFSLIYC